MTRREIKTDATLRAREELKREGKESLVVPSFDNPFTLNEWLDDVTETFTRVCSTLYLTPTHTIVSGQVSYNQPEMTIDDATITDSNSNTIHLVVTIPDRMLGYDPEWRTLVKSGPALYLIDFGTRFELWPVPDYALASGIHLFGTGKFTPTLWPNEDDECPILESWHRSLAKGLAAKIADVPNSSMLYREYITDKNYFTSENQGKVEAMRTRYADTDRHFYNDPWGNPLNW